MSLILRVYRRCLHSFQLLIATADALALGEGVRGFGRGRRDFDSMDRRFVGLEPLEPRLLLSASGPELAHLVDDPASDPFDAAALAPAIERLATDADAEPTAPINPMEPTDEDVPTGPWDLYDFTAGFGTTPTQWQYLAWEEGQGEHERTLTIGEPAVHHGIETVAHRSTGALEPDGTDFMVREKFVSLDEDHLYEHHEEVHHYADREAYESDPDSPRTVSVFERDEPAATTPRHFEASDTYQYETETTTTTTVFDNDGNVLFESVLVREMDVRGTVVGKEQRAVEAGTFDVVRFQEDVEQRFYDEQGNLVEESEGTHDSWAAEQIGAIEAEGPDAGAGKELLDYEADEPPETTVLSQHVFYNDSAYDGGDAGPGPHNDAAVAPDRQPLRPGDEATAQNITNAAQGLTGIMLDVVDAPQIEALTEDDLSFRIGNSNDLGGWVAAPAPQDVNVRQGEGASSSDRIELIWAENAIENQWLEVTVKANDVTGLTEDDVFYFGHRTGDITGDGRVTGDDVQLIRENQSGFGSAGIDNAYDINRTGRVDLGDVIAARNTQDTEPLELISVPTNTAPSAEPLTAEASAETNPTMASLSDTADLPPSSSMASALPDRLRAQAGWANGADSESRFDALASLDGSRGNAPTATNPSVSTPPSPLTAMSNSGSLGLDDRSFGFAMYESRLLDRFGFMSDDDEQEDEDADSPWWSREVDGELVRVL